MPCRKLLWNFTFPWAARTAWSFSFIWQMTGKVKERAASCRQSYHASPDPRCGLTVWPHLPHAWGCPWCQGCNSWLELKDGCWLQALLCCPGHPQTWPASRDPPCSQCGNTAGEQDSEYCSARYRARDNFGGLQALASQGRNLKEEAEENGVLCLGQIMQDSYMPVQSYNLAMLLRDITVANFSYSWKGAYINLCNQ